MIDCLKDCSNSVLTLYGLILAPILIYLSSRFWFGGLNGSFKPKLPSKWELK